MHTRLRTFVAVVVAALAVSSFASSAAAGTNVASAPSTSACADCGADSRPVTTGDNAFLTRIAVNRLNNGGSESGPPPVCSEEDIFFFPGKDGVADHIGRQSYETPDATEADFRGIDGNETPGTYWRLSCFFDDGFDPGYPGISIDFFPEITGPNLARLAVAEALVGVPAPEVHINPTGDQLVNFTSWLWVEGIATTEFVAPPVTVPGTSVSVTVSTSGVYWTMGDGAAFACEGVGTPYGSAAEPSCSHTYERSSAGQSDQRYHGTASIRWTASYTVNGAGPYAVDDAVVRTTPFSARVAESQAIVTG